MTAVFSFSTFSCKTKLWLQSRTLFSDLIFHKWPGALNLYCFELQNELPLLSRVLFWNAFSQIEASPWKHRPYLSDTWGNNTRTRALAWFHPQIHTLPECYCDVLFHFPTNWWCGWHDDVVDMMVWRLQWVRDSSGHPVHRRVGPSRALCQFCEISQGFHTFLHAAMCKEWQVMHAQSAHMCVQVMQFQRALWKIRIHKFSNLVLQTIHSYRLKGLHFNHFTGHFLGHQRQPSAT